MKKLLTGMMIMSLSAGAVSMAYAFADEAGVASGAAGFTGAESSPIVMQFRTSDGVAFKATVNAADMRAVGQIRGGDIVTVLGTGDARAREGK